MVIVAVVGMPGAGKTEATKVFEDLGYAKVYFGDVTFEILDEEGAPHTEANERRVREALREELGMGAYAIKNLPKVKKLVQAGSDVVIESLYSWSEYTIFKDEFQDDFIVLSVQSCPRTRYKRLADRGSRGMDPDVARKRDHAEIENIEKAGPIAMADFTVLNETGIDELHAAVSEVAKRLRT